MFLGVDTGGTFTDFVFVNNSGRQLDVATHKVLSTPDAPERAILQGIKELGLEPLVSQGKINIIHGSTVATNAALEGKGVKTVFITNRGFKDLFSIARQTRDQLYTLHVAPRALPIPEQYCLETSGRVSSQGQTLESLDENDLQHLIEQITSIKPDAIAINLLFSFVENKHEKKILEYLKQNLPDNIYICRSSEVLPEYREYERGIATWLNASLGPLVKHYLTRLQTKIYPSPLAIMQSSGGTMSSDQAANRAINLLLSGPAGGLAAAQFIGNLIGEKQLLTFDMGGTSTDVSLVDGEITLTTDSNIGDYPVAIPMVDMHTIGAGGGSIAKVDQGLLLNVGPQSAGADPGPACYGKGGVLATVTDANLVLGRLPGSIKLGGNFQPNVDHAKKAIEVIAKKLALTIDECAEGIIKLANEHMARALRVISVERGYNPANFRLCCFGGAGGLHLCALANELNMHKAIVPAHSGVLSALGMVLAPVQRQKSQSYLTLLKQADAEHITNQFQHMYDQALQECMKEGIKKTSLCHTFSLDLRYKGQASWLNIVWQDDIEELIEHFHASHKLRFGHDLNMPIEIVNIRANVHSRAKLETLAPNKKRPTDYNARTVLHSEVFGYSQAVKVYERSELAVSEQLTGPCIVLEKTATTFIDKGWIATVDDWGNMLLERK